MATVTVYYLDGRTQTFNNARVSKFKKHYYIWRAGPHSKGEKPLAKIPYSALHARSRTGRKGIDIRKF